MTGPFKIWLHRGFYLAFGLLTLAIPLLPLGFTTDKLPMPDLFFSLTICWVVREKDSAPMLVVAALAIIADGILMRPVGFWALMIIVISELVRKNDRLFRDGGILVELAFFIVSFAAALVIQNVVLFLIFADTFPVGQLVQIVIYSALCYPLFALILHYILRVRGPVTKNQPDRVGKVG